MNRYGIVYRDTENSRTLLGEFDKNGHIPNFVELRDIRYYNLPETMFIVVDVEHRNGQVGLMELHHFQMYRPDGNPDIAAFAVGIMLGMEDNGEAMFKFMFDQIHDEISQGYLDTAEQGYEI